MHPLSLTKLLNLNIHSPVDNCVTVNLTSGDVIVLVVKCLLKVEDTTLQISDFAMFCSGHWKEKIMFGR